MARWEIAETRRLIELRHGRPQLLLSQHCLRSVTERLRHARYHFQEARSLLKSRIDDRLGAESIYELTWPTDGERWSELDECLMRVEANAIACAQSIHSIADTLAHVVYFALALNLGSKPLREQDVSFVSVRAVLASVPTRIGVLRSLNVLASEASFAAVEAIVNHSKHRGIVEPRMSIEPPSSGAPYAFEFGAFTYRNVPYAEREIEKVLAPAYEAASKAVVDTGVELNAVLSV
jgi:hypothetical protein